MLSCLIALAHIDLIYSSHIPFLFNSVEILPFFQALSQKLSLLAFRWGRTVILLHIIGIHVYHLPWYTRVSSDSGPGLSHSTYVSSKHLARCSSSIDACEWMPGFLVPVVMVREEQIQTVSVYSLNPADCPQGSIFSLLVDIIWVKENLGLGVHFFKCCWLGGWGCAVLPLVENHCSGRFLQRNLIKHLSIKADLIVDLWF